MLGESAVVALSFLFGVVENRHTDATGGDMLRVIGAGGKFGRCWVMIELRVNR